MLRRDKAVFKRHAYGDRERDSPAIRRHAARVARVRCHRHAGGALEQVERKRSAGVFGRDGIAPRLAGGSIGDGNAGNRKAVIAASASGSHDNNGKQPENAKDAGTAPKQSQESLHG